MGGMHVMSASIWGAQGRLPSTTVMGMGTALSRWLVRPWLQRLVAATSR